MNIKKLEEKINKEINRIKSTNKPGLEELEDINNIDSFYAMWEARKVWKIEGLLKALSLVKSSSEKDVKSILEKEKKTLDNRHCSYMMDCVPSGVKFSQIAYDRTRAEGIQFAIDSLE